MSRKRTPRRAHARPPASNPVAAAIGRQQMASQMRSLAIGIYLTPDGERDPELLARLAWLIGLGADVAANTTPRSADAKRLHAALRTVLHMAVHGDARWQAAQAGVVEQAAQLAHAIALKHSALALQLAPALNVLANRIRQGVATMDDVAGAELYAAA